MPIEVRSHQVKFSDNAASATTNLTTKTINLWGGKNSFQVNVVGTGTVSVTATPQFSNDGVYWIAGTALSLTGTTSDTDGFTLDGAWAYCRIALTSITGTGATVTIFHGGGAA